MTPEDRAAIASAVCGYCGAALLLVDAGPHYREAHPDARPLYALTTRGAADALGITPGTVRDAIASGRLAAVRLGRDYVITPEAIADYRAHSLGRPGRRAAE